jgi:hypothetical protein
MVLHPTPLPLTGETANPITNATPPVSESRPNMTSNTGLHRNSLMIRKTRYERQASKYCHMYNGIRSFPYCFTHMRVIVEDNFIGEAKAAAVTGTRSQGSQSARLSVGWHQRRRR